MTRKALALASFAMALWSNVPACVRAQSEIVHLRPTTADPNAPFIGYGWRRAMRGRVSLAIPISTYEERGLFLALPVLIELHNDEEGDPTYLPHRYWRGRISVLGGYGVDDEDWTFQGGLGLEHESNHATDRDLDGYLSFHDLLAFASAENRRDGLILSGTIGVRVFFLSCTRRSHGCYDNPGSSGAEVFSNLSLRTHMSSEQFWGFFGALHSSYANGGDAMVEQKRVVARAGALLRSTPHGLFQFYVELLAGHELGLEGVGRSDVWLGGGVAWAPSW